MSEKESVTEWIERLKSADPQAAQPIWERYAERLARSKLPSSRRRVADEEDVVISVFDAVIRGIQEGRFAKLDDRQSEKGSDPFFRTSRYRRPRAARPGLWQRGP